MNNTEQTERVSRDGVAFAVANIRDIGFEHESKDCTVRAIKNATGVPYRDAHAFLQARGRKDCEGMYFSEVMTELVTTKAIVFGYRITKVEEGTTLDRTYARLRYPTLASSLRKCREGRYIIIKRGHTFAVIDGVVYDSGTVGTRSQVRSIFKLEPSSVVEPREAQRDADRLAVNQGGI
jgi:hypothetical protein